MRRLLGTLLIFTGVLLLGVSQWLAFCVGTLGDESAVADITRNILETTEVRSNLANSLSSDVASRLATSSATPEARVLLDQAAQRALGSDEVVSSLGAGITQLAGGAAAGGNDAVVVDATPVLRGIVQELASVDPALAQRLPASIDPIVLRPGDGGLTVGVRAPLGPKSAGFVRSASVVVLPDYAGWRTAAASWKEVLLTGGLGALAVGVLIHPKRRKVSFLAAVTFLAVAVAVMLLPVPLAGALAPATDRDVARAFALALGQEYLPRGLAVIVGGIALCLMASTLRKEAVAIEAAA